MRYTATLQRFDDASTDVAVSDDRDEVVAAAVAIYTALIPTILTNGRDELNADRKQLVEDDDAEGVREHDLNVLTVKLAAQLATREWGVGVYDSGRKQKPNKYPELIFWIGATREKPSV